MLVVQVDDNTPCGRGRVGPGSVGVSPAARSLANPFPEDSALPRVADFVVSAAAGSLSSFHAASRRLPR
jgi:hypothetical protein